MIVNIAEIPDLHSFIDILKDNEIVLYEEVQGTHLFIRYRESSLQIYNKPGGNLISAIELSIQNFYTPLIEHFESLPDSVKRLLDFEDYLSIEYFPDENPANIKYDIKPLGNMVITGRIHKDKWICDIDELNKWAELLKISSIPVIYKGPMKSDLLNAMYKWGQTSPQDLSLVFGTDNLAYFIYKYFNKNNSYLMNPGRFQKNIEKIILKIGNESCAKTSFALINKLYNKNIPDTNYVNDRTALLLDFCAFISGENYTYIQLTQNTTHNIYIELISHLFYKWTKDKVIPPAIDIPQFFRSKKFSINNKSIPKSVYFITEVIKNPIWEYAYTTIILNFFKHRWKPWGLINEEGLAFMNTEITRIHEVIEKKLNFISTDILSGKGYYIPTESTLKIQSSEAADLIAATALSKPPVENTTEKDKQKK